MLVCRQCGQPIVMTLTCWTYPNHGKVRSARWTNKKNTERNTNETNPYLPARAITAAPVATDGLCTGHPCRAGRRPPRGRIRLVRLHRGVEPVAGQSSIRSRCGAPRHRALGDWPFHTERCTMLARRGAISSDRSPYSGITSSWLPVTMRPRRRSDRRLGPESRLRSHKARFSGSESTGIRNRTARLTSW